MNKQESLDVLRSMELEGKENQAVEIAIRCIEKQIPEEPIRELVKEAVNEWGICVPVHYYTYKCPKCLTDLPVKYPSCEFCKQALDWRGVR